MEFTKGFYLLMNNFIIIPVYIKIDFLYHLFLEYLRIKYKHIYKMVGNAKLLIVGDAGVGKTAFVKQLTENVFEQRYIATLGVDSTKRFGRFSISDFSGQEKFSDRAREYAGAQYAIVMCDFTSRTTLKSLSGWISSIKNNCGDIPIVLCANKSDSQFKQFSNETLADSFRVLSSKHENLVGFFPISVKTNEGLVEVLDSF